MPTRTVFLALMLVLAVGCGPGADDGVSPIEAVGPSFSLQGGGEAWISGSSTITTSGYHYYQVCTSGLSGGSSYYAKMFTSKDGELGYGMFVPPSVPCWGHNVWVDSNSPDFTVWGKIYNVLQTYLGDSDTLSVTADVPPDPLSASITGDDSVAPDQECAWQAWGTGGTSPYSYTWWGGASGSSQTVYASLSQSGYIWVAVTDANSEADTAQVYVNVNSAYSCQER